MKFFEILWGKSYFVQRNSKKNLPFLKFHHILNFIFIYSCLYFTKMRIEQWLSDSHRLIFFFSSLSEKCDNFQVWVWLSKITFFNSVAQYNSFCLDCFLKGILKILYINWYTKIPGVAVCKGGTTISWYYRNTQNYISCILTPGHDSGCQTYRTCHFWNWGYLTCLKSVCTWNFW